MLLPFYHIDVFTRVPYQGNPASVLVGTAAFAEQQMQVIAREIGLPGNGFVWPVPGELDTFHIRFFTPQREVSLSGHTSLACAHALGSTASAGVSRSTIWRPNSKNLRKWSFLREDCPAVDDRSLDQPPQLLAQLTRETARLHGLRVEALPPGWLGKCHAMRRGAEAASGDWLLFTDADVVLEPSVLRRAMGLALHVGLDHPTAHFFSRVRMRFCRVQRDHWNDRRLFETLSFLAIALGSLTKVLLSGRYYASDIKGTAVPDSAAQSPALPYPSFLLTR